MVSRDSPEPLSIRRGRIIWDSTRCSGCRACEAICSLIHEGVVDPELSRIAIVTWEYEAWRSQAYVCKQCQGAECALACQTGAIHADPRTGALIIDEANCIGCQDCINACPCSPSRIRYHATKSVCVKCDLCDGKPQCVKSCQQRALVYEEA